MKNARISDKVPVAGGDALSDFEHRYEGQWLAGYHRMMGSHHFARSGNYYTMDADRGKAYYPFLTSSGNLGRRESVRKMLADYGRNTLDLDRAFRGDHSQEGKVFRQQRRTRRHALKSDHFEPFTDAAIEALQTLRRMRLENLVAKSKITPAHATAVATTNRTRAAALSV